jgi:hypothetical protein
MKTAVQFLIDEINNDAQVQSKTMKEWNEVFEQAKELYHDQILEAYREGRTDQQSTIDKWYNRTSADYFNQTYNLDK